VSFEYLPPPSPFTLEQFDKDVALIGGRVESAEARDRRIRRTNAVIAMQRATNAAIFLSEYEKLVRPTGPRPDDGPWKPIPVWCCEPIRRAIVRLVGLLHGIVPEGRR